MVLRRPSSPILRAVHELQALIDDVKAGYRTRDFDRFLPHLWDDVVYDFTRSRSPYRGIYHGVDEARRLFDEVFEAWETADWDVEKIHDLGQGRIVIATRITTRGRGSGVEATAHGAQLWILRDRRLVRVQVHQSQEEALADAEAEG
jgi:ketosteroid isomerase-like protein